MDKCVSFWLTEAYFRYIPLDVAYRRAVGDHYDFSLKLVGFRDQKGAAHEAVAALRVKGTFRRKVVRVHCKFDLDGSWKTTHKCDGSRYGPDSAG